MAPTPTAPSGPRFRLVVSLHDVAPATAEETASWLAELDALGVPASLLVVPGRFGGGPRLADAPEFAAWLRSLSGHEISLHGLHHAGVPGGPHWRQAVNRAMARGAGEFCALTEVQAEARLRAGLQIMREAGLPVTGFTPPGWLASPGTRAALRSLGFAYWTSQAAVHTLPYGRVHRMPALSHRPGGRGERTGARLMVAAARTLSRAGTSFRVALHPADLDRPGLREATRTAIETALRAGAGPLTYAELTGT